MIMREFDPQRDLPLRDIPDHWRGEGTPPDAAWIEAVNARIPEECWRLFQLYHPEGEYAAGDGEDPSAQLDAYAGKLSEFYETVREIDTFSMFGPGGPPALAGRIVTREAKEAVPGYLEYEAAMDRDGLDAAAYGEEAALPLREPDIDPFTGLDLSLPAEPGPARAQAAALAKDFAGKAVQSYAGADIPDIARDGEDFDYDYKG